jgi:hypothetical protein
MIGASHDDSITTIFIPMTSPPGLEIADEHDPSELCTRNDVVEIRSNMVLRVMIESEGLRMSFIRV